MKHFDPTTNWTIDEFRAYVFLYCAYANFEEVEEETEFIKNFISGEQFDAVFEEFHQDNDYQHIQKILAAVERFDLDRNAIETLFVQMVELFKADGEFDYLEENLFRGLRRLLSNIGK